jgi:hypothetical protein
METFRVSNEMVAGFQRSQNEHARNLGGWFHHENNARTPCFDPTPRDLQELAVAFLVHVARNGAGGGAHNRVYIVPVVKRSGSLRRSRSTDHDHHDHLNQTLNQTLSDEDGDEVFDDDELSDMLSDSSGDEDGGPDLRARMRKRTQNALRQGEEEESGGLDVDSDVVFPDDAGHHEEEEEDDDDDNATLELHMGVHQDDPTAFARLREEESGSDSGFGSAGEHTDLSVLDLDEEGIDLGDQTGELTLALALAHGEAAGADAFAGFSDDDAEQRTHDHRTAEAEEEEEDDDDIDFEGPLVLRVPGQRHASSPSSSGSDSDSGDGEEPSLGGRGAHGEHAEEQQADDETQDAGSNNQNPFAGFEDPAFTLAEERIHTHA